MHERSYTLHVTSESAEKDQNVYCYASNDPVNRVDFEGNKTIAAVELEIKPIRDTKFDTDLQKPHCSTFADLRALMYLAHINKGSIGVKFFKTGSTYKDIVFTPKQLIFKAKAGVFPSGIVEMGIDASMDSTKSYKDIASGARLFKRIFTIGKSNRQWSPKQAQSISDTLFGNGENNGVKEGDIIQKRVGTHPAKGHLWYIEDRFSLSVGGIQIDIIQLTNSDKYNGIRHKFVYKSKSAVNKDLIESAIAAKVGTATILDSKNSMTEIKIDKIRSVESFIDYTSTHGFGDLKENTTELNVFRGGK